MNIANGLYSYAKSVCCLTEIWCCFGIGTIINLCMENNFNRLLITHLLVHCMSYKLLFLHVVLSIEKCVGWEYTFPKFTAQLSHELAIIK